MNNENNNTPRLRFPEFTGEWVEKKLGEVATFKRGTTITAKDTIPGNVPVIAGGQTPSYFHNESNRDGETIAVSGSGAYAGFVSFWDIPVFLSDSFSVETKDELIKKYAFYYLKHQQNKLFLMQKGAGVPHVHGSDVGELLIYLPSSLAEQQKIASCLSELDALICSQGKKVDALKEKKKGMMQQLFPQPGETTPRLRFPGFTDEWVEKKLGEVCDITAGGDAPKTRFSQVKTDIFNIPVISNGVGENAIYGYTDSPKIINEAVTIAARGTIGYAEYRDYPYYPIIRLLSVMPKDQNIINTRYLSYILSIQKYDVANAGIPQLTIPMVSSVCAVFPSLPEQQKIASCLSELDALIADEAKQLDALKEHKKGLMQQLFPQPNK